MRIVRDIKVAQREDTEETLKECASDTHPIQCPCWKTWQSDKTDTSKNLVRRWHSAHAKAPNGSNGTTPHWARKCMPRNIEVVVLACLTVLATFNWWRAFVMRNEETISDPWHTSMKSNKPPYDIAISKHGIPTEKTFQISHCDFCWFRAVRFTYKVRTRSHRWIWIERRKKIELRLIAHMGPFPVLIKQVENNNIVTNNSNSKRWSCITILPCCIPSKASHTSKLTTEEFQRWNTGGRRKRTL